MPRIVASPGQATGVRTVQRRRSDILGRLSTTIDNDRRLAFDEAERGGPRSNTGHFNSSRI